MTPDQVLAAVTEVIHETFVVDMPIDRTMVASDVPGWDSLSHTILMLSLEEKLGVTLQTEEEFRNIGELVDFIGKRLKAG